MVISVFRVPRVIREDPSANSAENRLIDFLEASWHGNRADYSSPNRGKKKKKKERTRTSLLPYILLLHPLFHTPHQSNWIDLDLSHERRTRSVSPVTAWNRRRDAKLEAGLSIQSRVSLRESKNDFPIFRFRKFFVSSNRLHLPLILRFRISLRIMSKLSSMFRFSRV